jgi:hypothetical protein
VREKGERESRGEGEGGRGGGEREGEGEGRGRGGVHDRGTHMHEKAHTETQTLRQAHCSPVPAANPSSGLAVRP